MPCNAHKDFSGLVSKRRVYVLRTSYFYDAYLWRTKADLRKNYVVSVEPGGWKTIPDTAGECGEAFVCYMSGFCLGRLKMCPPKFGEIHFSCEWWTSEMVSHEACHAALKACARMGCDPAGVAGWCGDTFRGQTCGWITGPFLEKPIDDHELVCYAQGELYSALHSWLWEVDPPRKNEAA